VSRPYHWIALWDKLTGVLALLGEELGDLVAWLTIRDLDIVLGGAVIRHEGQEAVVGDVQLRPGCQHISNISLSPCGDTHKLVFAASNVGNIHVVGGRGEIFQLLAGEDVDGDHVDLGVTVLARLGGGHLDNFARAVLDDDVPVLPQRRALHRVRGRGTGVGALEGVLML